MRGGHVVREVMTPNPVTATPDMPVIEAVRRMAELDVGALPVVDERGRLVGIFSERDLLKRVVAKGLDPGQVRVGEVMTPSPVTVGPEEPVEEALRLMVKHRVRHLPVVDEEGRLVGIVSIRDIELVLV